MKPVTDPNILNQLEGGDVGLKPVTDPGLIARLEEVSPTPSKPQTFMDIVGNAIKYGIKSMVGLPDSEYVLGNKTEVPKQGFLNSAKEALLGVPEATGALVSGLGGSLIGKIAGEGQAAISGLRGDLNWGDKARQTRESVQKALTYQPITESGKALSDAIGSGVSIPFKAVAYPFQKAGEYATEKGYPNLGYVLEDVGDTLAWALGPKAAGKAGEIGSKAPEVAKQAFNKAVDYGLEKGIRQLVPGRGTYPLSQKKAATGRDMVQSIIENKDNLQLTDPATGETLPKGSLPSGKNAVVQMAQAADQTKRAIWNDIDQMKKSATGKGVVASLDPVIKLLDEKLKDPIIQDDPALLNHVLESKAIYEKRGSYSLDDMDRSIAKYNAGLKKYYDNPNRINLDADIVSAMRKSIDDAISNTEGPGFQALKNKYGSILDHEKEINQRAVVAVRRNPKGIADLSDIVIAAEALRGLGKIASGVAGGGTNLLAMIGMEGAKRYWKGANDPNNIISDMFKKADENLGYYGTDLKESLPPLGPPEPQGIPMPNIPLSMDWLYKGKAPTPLQGIEMPQQSSGLMLEKDVPRSPLMGPVGPGTTPSSVTPQSGLPWLKGRTSARPAEPIRPAQEPANFFKGTIPETTYAPGSQHVEGVSPDVKTYWVSEKAKEIAAQEKRKGRIVPEKIIKQILNELVE